MGALWLCCRLDGAPALVSEDSSQGLCFPAVDCYAEGKRRWARDEECEGGQGMRSVRVRREGGGKCEGEEGGGEGEGGGGARG